MPPAAWNLPVSHALQWALDVPSTDELPKRPASQPMQAALCAWLHFPPGHAPLHELLVEPPVPNRPAAHSVHAVRPVSC